MSYIVNNALPLLHGFWAPIKSSGTTITNLKCVKTTHFDLAVERLQKEHEKERKAENSKKRVVGEAAEIVIMANTTQFSNVLKCIGGGGHEVEPKPAI